MLRLDYVEGVTPAKWLRIWNERMPEPLQATRTEQPAQLDRLRAGEADVAFVRLPVDADGLNLIPLWEEASVVAAPRDHAIGALDELTSADLADEPLLPDADGYAVRINGSWKVAATTFCSLLTLQGDSAPACKDPSVTALPQ